MGRDRAPSLIEERLLWKFEGKIPIWLERHTGGYCVRIHDVIVGFGSHAISAQAHMIERLRALADDAEQRLMGQLDETTAAPPRPEPGPTD